MYVKNVGATPWLEMADCELAGSEGTELALSTTSAPVFRSTTNRHNIAAASTTASPIRTASTTTSPIRTVNSRPLQLLVSVLGALALFVRKLIGMLSLFKGIPKWFFSQVFFWRPGAPMQNNHTFSGRKWFVGLAAFGGKAKQPLFS